MASNTGVIGQIVSNGSGVEGLVVKVYDREQVVVDDELGKTITNEHGDFEVTYSSWDYGIEWYPDIVIKVFDHVGRLVYQSVEFETEAGVYAAPLINIPTADLSGYKVTLLSGSPTMVSAGNSLSMLIDNEVAWRRLTERVQAARNSIYCAQLYFDVEELFTTFNQGGSDVRLEEEILAANQNRDVECKILVNDFPGAPYPTDTAGVVEDYFDDDDRGPHTVEVQTYSLDVNRAFHAKMTIIDATYCIFNASPLLQEYFDSTSHLIVDSRRGQMSWPKNAIKVPIHDVSVEMRGPCLVDTMSTFSMIWQQAGGDAIGGLNVDVAGGHTVQVTRTLPGNEYVDTNPDAPDGERGILESYLRAIGQATEVIYLENQYFTEPLIIDALLAQLQAQESLQAILVLNNVVDIPRYQTWQTELLERFINEARQLEVHNRIGLFTLWSHEDRPVHTIIRNYVHSKVGIVDDSWATVGSANLDGVSLNHSQHLLGTTRLDKKEEVAVELNIAVFNGVDGEPQSDFPLNLRKVLWAEHLGYEDPEDNALVTSPPNGWLSLFISRSGSKLAGLRADPPTVHPCRLLPWNAKTDPEEYLIEAGVPKSNLDRFKIKESV